MAIATNDRTNDLEAVLNLNQRVAELLVEVKTVYGPAADRLHAAGIESAGWLADCLTQTTAADHRRSLGDLTAVGAALSATLREVLTVVGPCSNTEEV